MTVVGSYRRGAETSGDIDVLLRVPSAWTAAENAAYLGNVVETLETMGYMEYVLALGDKKAMGIARLPEQGPPMYKARRVDVLITPEHEYACALLYFTGSDMFNVAFRQHALQKGYTLNEHGMTPLGEAAQPPPFHTEEDIFRFLSLQYVEPSKRKEGALRALIKRPKVVHT